MTLFTESLFRAIICLLLSSLASLVLLFSTGCTNKESPIKETLVVDRHNPESVLRAYFSEWEKGDWTDQTSLMDEKFANMVPEPVETIHILEIQAISNSSLTDRTYNFVFEIKVKDQGVSMQNGQYNWNYYLSWYSKRASWLITNYGVG